MNQLYIHARKLWRELGQTGDTIYGQNSAPNHRKKVEPLKIINKRVRIFLNVISLIKVDIKNGGTMLNGGEAEEIYQ